MGVRLAWAVLLSLVIVGAMAGYHHSRGALVRSWTVWYFYVDPWLESHEYELRRYRSFQSDRFALSKGLSVALSGRFRITDGELPAWVRTAVEAGEDGYSRVYLGRPLAFARYESTQRRWLGLVPSTTRLEFPGFLVLVGLVYGGLWALGRLKRIPDWLRSRRLRRRGLCGRCGYDLAGLAGGVCPECGETRCG
ncbi:MAG: hypothetical protein D6692_07995 [Planctomycetota bacterium]|nr:MAG: hypothetical protein D6692_07995 [Planctomycetota bacterium]